MYQQRCEEYPHKVRASVHNSRTLPQDDEDKGPDKGRRSSGEEHVGRGEGHDEDGLARPHGRAAAKRPEQLREAEIEDAEMEPREGQDVGRSALAEGGHHIPAEAAALAQHERLDKRRRAAAGEANGFEPGAKPGSGPGENAGAARQRIQRGRRTDKEPCGKKQDHVCGRLACARKNAVPQHCQKHGSAA